MAQLIPSISVDEISVKSERDIARALIEQLPTEVIVYHSYPWLRQNRNDRTGHTSLLEGEADFLILWPSMGLLVLEVKGGKIEYDPSNRRWFRRLPSGEERDIKDPFEQARRNMHAIVDDISKRVYRGRTPAFAYGYAVVFPNCRYRGHLPPGADPAILMASEDLHRMTNRISRALRKWSRNDPPAGIPKENLREVKKAILPRFNLFPALSRTIEAQEETLIRMTDEQIRLLDFLGAHNRAAIEGVAGSGKTLMAKAQAQRFAEQGLRTLFLCFNKTLAEWLRNELPKEHRESLHVTHFHKLCSDMCRETGVEFGPPEGDSSVFWRHEAPDLLWEALESLPDERYDAIVVDEGQDFHPDWWDPIQALERDPVNGYLYVFYDPAQNLYNESGVSIPSLGKPYRLPTNCRNTLSITETCSDIIGQPIETKPSTPKGLETKIIEVGSTNETIQHLKERVKEWSEKQGVRPSQIALLSPFKRMNSSLATIEHLSGISITEDLDAWRTNGGILFSTIRSFKGLEADIVIIIDVIEPDSITTFLRSDLYVGCSRAKHVLVIISSVPPSKLFLDGESPHER